MTYVKKSKFKRNIALLAIIVLAVIGGFVAFAFLSVKPVEVGVKVGDTFTYQLEGASTLTAANATETPGFYQYNQTEYYKVTITGVNGTKVSLEAVWKFKNGTEVPYQQTIDIATGDKTDENGFWAIYPAKLEKTDLLRPRGYDGYTVNNTDTKTYTSGVRSRCYWFINNQFFDYTDPTQNTLMYDYRQIFFDKETGMMTSFTWYQFFNNPEKQQVVTWKLVDTSVWQI
jgi:hypothetical protein